MDVSVWMMGREIKCVLLKDVKVCDSIYSVSSIDHVCNKKRRTYTHRAIWLKSEMNMLHFQCRNKYG